MGNISKYKRVRYFKRNTSFPVVNLLYLHILSKDMHTLTVLGLCMPTEFLHRHTTTFTLTNNGSLPAQVEIGKPGVNLKLQSIPI